jgi:ubiquinone/menaquinone biosynthesis C-methylase UbiE
MTTGAGSPLVLYRCPRCRRALAPAADGHLECLCGWAVRPGEVLDFTGTETTAEQAHYEELYASEPKASGQSLPELESLWASHYYPMNQIVLERIGDITGKVLLLVGNGTSEKELFLLTRDPALLVFSDLSPAALRAIRDRYAHLADNRIVFAAIDAQDLPFADEQVDLVYAYAVVHHLPDVAAFLTEIARVLRPGGRCVFMDDAYSPGWQFAKKTFLRPLMRYFHHLDPISPEDKRFTLGGGFKEEELAERIRAAGGEPWFTRSGLVHYLVTRASERLPPRSLWSRVRESDRFLTALIAVDDALGRIPAVRRNQIRLVWGFDKPAAPHPQSP